MPLVALALVLAAPVAASYDAGVTQETRAATTGTLAFQLSPFLGLSSAPSAAQGFVRYEPRLVLDAQSSSGFSQALHRATLSGRLLDRGRSRLFFNGRGSYGRTDLSPLAALAEGAAPSLDRPVQARPLGFMDAELTAGVEERIGRRLSVLADASYGLSGGASAQDRRLLPLFEVARLRTALQLFVLVCRERLPFQGGTAGFTVEGTRGKRDLGETSLRSAHGTPHRRVGRRPDNGPRSFAPTFAGADGGGRPPWQYRAQA